MEQNKKRNGVIVDNSTTPPAFICLIADDKFHATYIRLDIITLFATSATAKSKEKKEKKTYKYTNNHDKAIK